MLAGLEKENISERIPFNFLQHEFIQEVGQNYDHLAGMLHKRPTIHLQDFSMPGGPKILLPELKQGLNSQYNTHR